MRKLVVAMFMFVCGGSAFAMAQDPVKPQPAKFFFVLFFRRFAISPQIFKLFPSTNLILSTE